MGLHECVFAPLVFAPPRAAQGWYASQDAAEDWRNMS